MKVRSLIQTLGHTVHVGSDLVWRVLWVFMAAVHAPALVSAWRCVWHQAFAIETLPASLGLSAAMLFFVFKILGVSFLRVRVDRHAAITIAAIVALMHVGVVQTERDSGSALEAAAAILVTTTYVLGTYSIVRRIRRGTLPRFAFQVRHGSTLCLLAGAAWMDAFIPHCWTAPLRRYHLRAPPA